MASFLDSLSNFEKGTLGGGMIGAGLLGNAFSNKNPAKGAMKYLNQVPGVAQSYYDPYINAGKNALPTLQQQLQSLISNPTALMKMIGSQYQQSPGYQFEVDQATKAANQAAAAGGMAGSPAEQQALAEVIQGISSRDYNNFLNQGIGLYNQGLAGEEGINEMGYKATNNLVQQIIDSILSKAKLSYAGQVNKNESSGGIFGPLLGLGAKISGII